MSHAATARMLALNPTIPDYRTALADCRIAIGLAAGTAVDDIDPSLGYDISERAYRIVREQWAVLAKEASPYHQAEYERVATLWRRYRPDLAADWPEWGDAR